MSAPKVGDIVIYHQGDHEAALVNYADDRLPGDPEHTGTNGTREHPAIVTRVWSETCVNLVVFLDGVGGVTRNSITERPALPDGVVDASGNSNWSVRPV